MEMFPITRYNRKKNKKKKKEKWTSKWGHKEHYKLEKLPHHNSSLCTFDAPWCYSVNATANHHGIAIRHYSLSPTYKIVNLLYDIQTGIVKPPPPPDPQTSLTPGVDAYVKQNPTLSPIVTSHGVVLVWATGPMYWDMIKLCKTLNLRIVAQFISWCKDNKHNNDPIIGVGYYTRSNWEGMFICVPPQVKVEIHRERHLKFEGPDQNQDQFPMLHWSLFEPRLPLKTRKRKRKKEKEPEVELGPPRKKRKLIRESVKSYISEIGSRPVVNILHTVRKQHSQKPKDAISLINMTFVKRGYIPYEVFSRDSHDSRWIYIGNQKDKF